MTPEQLARLPIRAQNYIKNLEQQRDEARAAEREALLDTDPESTNTRLMSSLHHNEVGLPNNAGVRHYLTNSLSNDRTYIDSRLQRVYTGRAGGDTVERLTIHGSGSLSITMASANLFYVDLIDR